MIFSFPHILNLGQHWPAPFTVKLFLLHKYLHHVYFMFYLWIQPCSSFLFCVNIKETILWNMPIFWLWTAVVWTCQLCWLTVMFYLNWWLIIPNGSFMGKCKTEKPPYLYCLGLQIVGKIRFFDPTARLWEEGKGKEILRKDKLKILPWNQKHPRLQYST